MKIGDVAHLILEESDVRRIVLGGIFWPAIITQFRSFNVECDMNITKHA